MQRSLMLMLNGGKENKMPSQSVIGLTLETMDSEELDSYISSNFESSDDIRKKYEKEITRFLEQHHAYIEKAEEKLGRKFNGAIVVTEMDEDLNLERKKVLYKKYRIIFNQITNEKSFMLAIANRDYINFINARKKGEPYERLFSEFHSRELRFHSTTDNQFRKVVGQWRNQIKNSSIYYEIMRTILKEYENRYKELGLSSPDMVYRTYETVRKGNLGLRSPRATEIQKLEQLKQDVVEAPKPVEPIVQEDDFEQLTIEGFGPVKKRVRMADIAAGQY